MVTDFMWVCNLILSVDEVLAVQPPVISDQVEDAVSGGRETTTRQLCVVLRGGLDGCESFLLPNLSRPVPYSQEEVTLLAVLWDGVDGAMVWVHFFAEDHIRVELFALGRVLVGHNASLLQGKHVALLSPDYVLEGIIRVHLKTRGVEQLRTV